MDKFAAESVAKREQDKKEGKHNPEAYTRENRWNDYVADQEKKKKEEEDRKNASMFKEYNEQYKDNKDVSRNS